VFTGVNVDCSGLIGQIIGDDSDVVAAAILEVLRFHSSTLM